MVRCEASSPCDYSAELGVSLASGSKQMVCVCVCVFRQNTKKSSVRAQKKRVRVKEMLTDTQTCSISARLRFLDTDV